MSKLRRSMAMMLTLALLLGCFPVSAVSAVANSETTQEISVDDLMEAGVVVDSGELETTPDSTAETMPEETGSESLPYEEHNLPQRSPARKAVANSGTTGSCTWTLEDTVLTISGDGSMADYSYNLPAPWGDDITAVYIKHGVTKVGNEAFYGCTQLSTVMLPNSLTEIGRLSFAACHSLDEITIPYSVTTIGSSAFRGCNRLTTITVPAGVTSIGSGAFSSCNNLTGIFVEPENACFSNDDSGVLFNKDQTKLLMAPGAISGEYTVPGSVRTIEESAFRSCGKLASVIISDGVEFIGAEAFVYCELLSCVTIADSVTTIYGFAFAECSNLTTVSIGSGVTYIGAGAFYLCKKLDSVIIPAGLETIYTNTFFGCSNLRMAVIPDSVTVIENGAFTLSGIKTICFTGTTVQWNWIRKGSSWDSQCDYKLVCLESFTVFYTTESGHIFPVPYEPNLKVECGSSFNGADLNVYSMTVKVLSGPATVSTGDNMTVTVEGTTGTIELALFCQGVQVGTLSYLIEDGDGGLFEAGYGTLERPFLIGNATQFSNIRKKPGSQYHFMLINHITLGNMEPIDSFSGTLDGMQYDLQKWSYEYYATGNMGLFKENSGTIRNLTMFGCSLTHRDGAKGSINVGMVCGTNTGTIEYVVVEQCNVSGDMGTPDADCGDCTTHVGGICGVNLGKISKTGVRDNELISGYAASMKDGAQVNAKVGGIAGYAYKSAVFENVYAHDNYICGYAYGNTWKGGFLWLTTYGANCYSNVGGLVGACGDSVQLKYVLGYNNEVVRANSGKSGESLGGSLMGYSGSSAVDVYYGYSEESDGAFCGRGALTSNSIMLKLSRLCWGGIMNDLDAFDGSVWMQNTAMACAQHGSGSHLEIAPVRALSITNTQENYDYKQALNLNQISIEGIRFNTYPQVYVPVVRGYKVTGYDPLVGGSHKVRIDWGNSYYEHNIFTVTVGDHVCQWGTAATCFKGPVCKHCGYEDKSAILQHDYVPEIKEPTCSGGGYTTYTCSGCGDSYEDNAVAALGHKLDFMGVCVRCGGQFATLRDYTIYVCDAETAAPIAGAMVNMGGIKVLTDANGAAKYQIINDLQRKLVVEASDYPKYENLAFAPGEMPDTYIYLESEDTGIYEAWCNGDNVLLVDSQINKRAPTKEAKLVIKGRAQTNIVKYEIVQDGKVLASSADGTFKIKNPYFLLNTPVYARMHTDGRDGHNMFERELNISVVGVSFEAQITDLIPFIGGTKFTFDETAPSLFQEVEFPIPGMNLPDNRMFKIYTDNERLVITYGLETDLLDKDTEDKSSREIFRELLKRFDQQNNPSFWPKGKKKSEVTATVALIIEFGADGNVTSAYGEIHIGYEFSYSWGKTFVVWIVPIYAGVKFNAGGELTVSEIGYSFEEAKIMIPDNQLRLYAELSAYGGVGCSLISAGVYGTAGGELIWGIKDLIEYTKYRIYGEVGLYARVDPIFWEAIEFKLPLLAGEFYGPNGQVKAKQKILTPENYEIAAREYLENRSAWKTPSTIAKRGDSSGVLQTSSYTAIEPRIVQSGDTVMMLFMDDDGSAGYNYQHLYYSLLDPATNAWMTPVRVDDSAYADIDYDVYADESGIYLTYSKIPEITEENRENHIALLQGVEIYTARYDGSGFVDHTNVSNNDCYDSQPQVTADAVVWVSNATNDTLGENSNNTLMLAQKTPTGWGAPVVLNDNGATVTSIDMGALDGKGYVAVVRDADCDLTTDDRRLQLIDFAGTASYIETADYTSEGVRFEQVDGKATLQWVCAGNIWILTDLDQTPVAVFAEAEPAINEAFKYQQLGDGRAVILFAKNAMEGNKAGSSLYGVYYADGQWGQPVAITDHEEGMYIDAFDACYYQDKLLFAYINTQATVEEDSIARTCNFVSSSIELKNDLAAEEAVFLESALFEGVDMDVVVHVTNHSWQKLQNVKVQVKAKTVVYEQNITLDEAIASGESERVTFTLPKNVLTPGAQYTVELTCTDWTDADLGNNAVALDLWYADLEVTARQIMQGDKAYVQYAVTNKGNHSGSGKLVIYGDKNEDGTYLEQPQLYSQDIAVEIGKSITAMVPATFEDDTVYVVIEPTTPEKYTFNNEQSLSLGGITRTTTEDITGQKAAIPNPIFKEPYIIYDRYTGGDITAPATENGWSFTGIQEISTDDYSYSNSTLTLKGSYLQSLDLGYHYYTLSYSLDGETTEAMLIVEIRDHAPLSVKNVMVTYDGTAVELADLSYETPSKGAVSTRYTVDGESWVDGLPTNAGEYTVELCLAAEENGFYTAAQKQFYLTITKATRSISAPQNIQRTASGITFSGAVPEKEPTDGMIAYGYSTVCDPNTVAHWSGTGTIPVTSSDITYYLYARITGSSNYEDAYSAAYITTGVDAEPVVAVYRLGMEQARYSDFGKAAEACNANSYVKLLKDVQVNITLQKDLYVDLSGFDMTGCIELNGFKVYGLDSTTDKYTCANRGIFSCVDASGTDIAPLNHHKSTVTGTIKRYMAIREAAGWSFHRFYLGVTHMSVRPSVTSVGFKAVFYADDMVISNLNAQKAFGYSLTLEGYAPVSAYKSRASFVSGRSVTLRVDNYDVEHFGEKSLSACVMLKLGDGTVIESSSVTMTLRQLMEQLNADPSQMTEAQLKVVASMIEKFEIMKSWNIGNLIA